MSCFFKALTVLLCLFPFASAVVHGDEEPRTLLMKIVEARGGTRLGKVEAYRIQFRSTGAIGEQTITVTGSVAVRGVNYLRTETHIGKSNSISVLNQDRGWVREADTTREMSLAEIVEAREEAFLSWTNMVLATSEPGVVVQRLPEIKDENRTLLGLRISKKGYPDLDLWVDPNTYLPVRQRFQFKRPDGQVVTMESRATENKKFGGVVVPTKTTTYRNGKRWLETEVVDVQIFTDGKKLDFSKP